MESLLGGWFNDDNRREIKNTDGRGARVNEMDKE